MLLEDFYTIKQIQAQADSSAWEILVVLNPEHPLYRGHFPDYLVVPGVCLLQIIKECAEKIRKESLQYTQIISCKFLSAIHPGKTPDISFRLIFKNTEGGLSLQVEGRTEKEYCIKLKAILTQR